MITTKRWNDPKELNDGLRVLVTRYRPRGLPKSQETWDIWMRELAPSVELHAAFYGKHGKKISWPSYRAAFLREMKESKAAIRDLAQRIQAGEHITLLCSSACVHDNRCHRALLREIIEAETHARRAA
jgi:uncharacterized protein YeaO (DUF488 family)